MSEEVTIEIDDIHELMFKEMTEGEEDAPPLAAWAENRIQQTLYQAYQQQQ